MGFSLIFFFPHISESNQKILIWSLQVCKFTEITLGSATSVSAVHSKIKKTGSENRYHEMSKNGNLCKIHKLNTFAIISRTYLTLSFLTVFE